MRAITSKLNHAILAFIVATNTAMAQSSSINPDGLTGAWECSQGEADGTADISALIRFDESGAFFGHAEIIVQADIFDIGSSLPITIQMIFSGNWSLSDENRLTETITNSKIVGFFIGSEVVPRDTLETDEKLMSFEMNMLGESQSQILFLAEAEAIFRGDGGTITECDRGW